MVLSKNLSILSVRPFFISGIGAFGNTAVGKRSSDTALPPAHESTANEQAIHMTEVRRSRASDTWVEKRMQRLGFTRNNHVPSAEDTTYAPCKTR